MAAVSEVVYPPHSFHCSGCGERSALSLCKTKGFIGDIGCWDMVFRLRLVCNTQYIVVFAYIYIQYIGFPCHPTHVPATNIQIERLSLTPNRIASSIDDAKTKKPGGLLSHLRIVNHQAGDVEYSVILRCNLLFSLSAKPRRQSLSHTTLQRFFQNATPKARMSLRPSFRRRSS